MAEVDRWVNAVHVCVCVCSGFFFQKGTMLGRIKGAPDVRNRIRPVSRLYFPVRVRGHRGIRLPSLQLELRHRRVIGNVHWLWLLPIIEHVLGRIAIAPDYQGANLGIQSRWVKG